MAPDKKASNGHPITAFFSELMRRRVLHIGGAYVAGAWLGAEILQFLFVQFGAPDWADTVLAIVLVVGFPIAMVLAWVIQVQGDGSWTIDPSRGEHKTVAAAVLLGLLITVGLSWLLLRKPPPPPDLLPDSLAVLPFSESGATLNQQTVADTLYRSVMEGLDRSGELTLVRLGPVEWPDDPADFGLSLSVEGLALGTLARTAGGAVVEMQYLDVAEEEVTWSQAFDLDPTRITETANAIANGLLQAKGLPVLSRERFTGTDDPEAYESFLRAEEMAACGETAMLARAAERYQDAIDADPGYVQAYIGLAQSIYDLLEAGNPAEAESRALKTRAERAVDIALKLDPESADAISLLGLRQQNRQLRAQAYERALELDPRHHVTFFRYAAYMRESGDLEKADQYIQRALTLRPDWPRYLKESAEILRLQGHDEKALAEEEKARLFRPDCPRQDRAGLQ